MSAAPAETPILVTGANRSGTTWVGRMLCASGELEYVHEPFNPGIWPRVLGVDTKGHYAYVCAENEGPMVPAIERILRHRAPLLSQVGEARSARDVGRLGKAAVRTAGWAIRRRRVLLKDPIAMFSAPWLADRFDARVVVMIRHPAAYVSSIDRLGWRFDFGFLLSQPLLMRDLLEPWRDEIEARAADPGTPFDQAITLWRIKYGVVDRWRRERPDFDFVLYEDLASEPVDGFEALYRRLGLTFDGGARTTIESFTGSANPADRPPSEWSNVRRDSRAARNAWLARLDQNEIDRIRVGVGEIADRFYTDSDWRP
ncbi:MAG: sulfotransferase [Dehalococcoidia bacterium]